MSNFLGDEAEKSQQYELHLVSLLLNWANPHYNQTSSQQYQVPPTFHQHSPQTSTPESMDFSAPIQTYSRVTTNSPENLRRQHYTL